MMSLDKKDSNVVDMYSPFSKKEYKGHHQLLVKAVRTPEF